MRTLQTHKVSISSARPASLAQFWKFLENQPINLGRSNKFH